jgi:hypothetical protein
MLTFLISLEIRVGKRGGWVAMAMRQGVAGSAKGKRGPRYLLEGQRLLQRGMEYGKEQQQKTKTK